MELIETKKPGHFYYVDANDYIYVKDGKVNRGPQWYILYFRCLTSTCKGRAIWKRCTEKSNQDAESIEFTEAHSHEPSLEKKLQLLYSSRLRSRASCELTTSLKRIFFEEKDLADKNGISLGQYKSHIGLLKRARKNGESGNGFTSPIASIPDIHVQTHELNRQPISEHSYSSHQKATETMEVSEPVLNRRAIETIYLHDQNEFESSDVEMEEEDPYRESHSPLVRMSLPALVAPVFCPFYAHMTINSNLINSYANVLKENGICGVLVNGEIGEGFSLSVKERKYLAATWIEQKKKNPDLQVMVHVGGAPFNEILDLAKHAKEIQADAVVCLPDLYRKPKTCQDLIRYLKFVAYEVPQTPFIYDHDPSLSGVNLNMGQFLEEVAGNIPNFAGIKFSSGNLEEGIEALNANSGKFFVFWGSDASISSALLGGFESIIAPSLSIFPSLCTKMIETGNKSNFTECRSQQEILTDICCAVKKHGDFVPGMKALMNMFTELPVGKVKEPLYNLKNKQLEELKEQISAIIQPK